MKVTKALLILLKIAHSGEEETETKNGAIIK